MYWSPAAVASALGLAGNPSNGNDSRRPLRAVPHLQRGTWCFPQNDMELNLFIEDCTLWWFDG